MCRLTKGQRNFYSGYKKQHAFKYQAIMTPNGLISYLGGPFEGRMGDWAAWKATGLEDIIRQLNDGVPPEEQAYLYVRKPYRP